MKRILIPLFGFLWLPTLIMAQVDTDEINFYQTIFGSEKKVIMASFVELEGDTRDAFWDLYNEYEAKRQELGRQRMKNLEQYAEQYPRLTEEEADAVISTSMDLQKAMNKLIDTYCKKIRKTTDAATAAQFYHLELFFLAAIRVNILESIPIIEELGE